MIKITRENKKILKQLISHREFIFHQMNQVMIQSKEIEKRRQSLVDEMIKINDQITSLEGE